MDTKILAIGVVIVLVAAGLAAAFVLTDDRDDDQERDLDVNLEIYGNADKNSRVDSADADLVQSWVDAVEADDQSRISELSPRINLWFADANRDGKVDAEDVAQIRAIADGTAEHLWFVDGTGKDRDMDVGDSIKRIGCEYYANTEAMLILGQADRIAAVDNAPYLYRDFYFDDAKRDTVKNMGAMNEPDYDYVNTLDLDVLLVFNANPEYQVKQEKMIGTDVLFLGMYNPDLSNTQQSSFIQGILKAGYIFGAVDRAEDYTDWILEYRDRMLSKAGSIADADKPVVAACNYRNTYFQNGTENALTCYVAKDPLGQAIALAGGTNINDRLDIHGPKSSVKIAIDAFFSDDADLKYIVCHNVKHTYGGGTFDDTPDHGYLEDDDTQFREACSTALGQDLMNGQTVAMAAGDFRNGCSGGVLLAAYLGNLINPDLYGDIDPVALHNEYIDWMGIGDYDLKDHGVFFVSMEATG